MVMRKSSRLIPIRLEDAGCALEYQPGPVYSTERGKIPYDPETSERLGHLAVAQRAMYNQAIEWALAHPNDTESELFMRLTQLRADSVDWRLHRRVIQEAAITQAIHAVKRFLQADLSALRDCIDELRYYRGESNKKPDLDFRRDVDTKRLYRSRLRDRHILAVYDARVIRRVPGQPRQLQILGITLRLSKRLPQEDIRAVSIIERTPRPSGRMPLGRRSYPILYHVRLSDRDHRHLSGQVVGTDLGVKHPVTTSDGEHYDNPGAARIAEINNEVRNLKRSMSRRKRGSASWRKDKRKLGRLAAERERLNRDFELATGKSVVAKGDSIALDGIEIKNMTRSARGTPENPGQRVAQKKGLNRRIARARPGALRATIAGEAEKAGKYHKEVDPKHTSTTCQVCGHRDGKSRLTQADFRCTRCQASAHADQNAAAVLAQRLEQELRALAEVLSAGPGETSLDGSPASAPSEPVAAQSSVIGTRLGLSGWAEALPCESARVAWTASWYGTIVCHLTWTIVSEPNRSTRSLILRHRCTTHNSSHMSSTCRLRPLAALSRDPEDPLFPSHVGYQLPTRQHT